MPRGFAEADAGMRRAAAQGYVGAGTRKRERRVSSRHRRRSSSSVSSTVRRLLHSEAFTGSRTVGIVSAHPRLSAAALLVLLVLVSVLSMRLLSHPAAKNDKSADMLPARFGWQWCPEEA